MEEACEYEWNDEQQTDPKLNHYECTILNDFQICDSHAKNAEIERW